MTGAVIYDSIYKFVLRGATVLPFALLMEEAMELRLYSPQSRGIPARDLLKTPQSKLVEEGVLLGWSEGNRIVCATGQEGQLAQFGTVFVESKHVGFVHEGSIFLHMILPDTYNIPTRRRIYVGQISQDGCIYTVVDGEKLELIARVNVVSFSLEQVAALALVCCYEIFKQTYDLFHTEQQVAESLV